LTRPQRKFGSSNPSLTSSGAYSLQTVSSARWNPGFSNQPESMPFVQHPRPPPSFPSSTPDRQQSMNETSTMQHVTMPLSTPVLQDASITTTDSTASTNVRPSQDEKGNYPLLPAQEQPISLPPRYDDSG